MNVALRALNLTGTCCSTCKLFGTSWYERYGKTSCSNCTDGAKLLNSDIWSCYKGNLWSSSHEEAPRSCIAQGGDLGLAKCCKTLSIQQSCLDI